MIEVPICFDTFSYGVCSEIKSALRNNNNNKKAATKIENFINNPVRHRPKIR